MIKCLDLLKINSSCSSTDLWFGIVNLDLNCICSCCLIALSMADSASSAFIPIMLLYQLSSHGKMPLVPISCLLVITLACLLLFNISLGRITTLGVE